MDSTEFRSAVVGSGYPVSVISISPVELGIDNACSVVRFVLRHDYTGHEFKMIAVRDEKQQVQVVTDYTVLGASKGLRAGCNARGQHFWEIYAFPEGWQLGRYMFPDEHDVFLAVQSFATTFPFPSEVPPQNP